MSTINPATIVDAVLSDILASSGLTPRTIRRYAEPFTVKPEDCPLLAVWIEVTDFELLTTTPLAAYERKHQVMMAWYEPNRDGAEYGGIGDPLIVQALDATGEALVARVVSYAGGVPTFGAQLIATLKSKKISAEAGVLWECRIEFTAEEAS